jgi:SAM-dependent methyltransferase
MTRPTTAMHIVDRPPLEGVGYVKLPWDDPGFSQRMLAEHLDQRHDKASRRLETIDAHVEWIVEELLSGRPGSVLDLGCGPGLYTQRLAAGGCTCRGIDISPSSIEHARTMAPVDGASCTYVLGDITTADLGADHDLAILLFGELNTFRRCDVPELLRRVHLSLRPGGRLLLEVHTRGSVISAGQQPAGWYTSHGGLFAPGPHLVFHEQQWVEETGVTSTRYFVIEIPSGTVNEYGETLTAYTDADYRRLLTAAGFVDLGDHHAMGPQPHPDMQIITGTAGRGVDAVELQLNRR